MLKATTNSEEYTLYYSTMAELQENDHQ